MGSCGGSLTSEITGEDGGLSVLSLSSGSTSDSSVKHAASVPGSADKLGPGDLYMRCKERQQNQLHVFKSWKARSYIK